MHIAILGATSQIAKDLVLSFAAQGSHELALFARRPEVVSQWLASVGLSGRYAVADFGTLGTREHFDAIFNFVGVGNPAQAKEMGNSIFDITLRFDELVLDYLQTHPACRYLFLSSGAAYGSNFDKPVDQNTKAVVPINNLQPQDWYGAAKLHAECRHRSFAHLPIVDIRVFNYFSSTQDLSARFLVTDILRAIRDGVVLQTSADYIVRDFLHPADFCRLVDALLTAPPENAVVDCYTKSPIDKPTLLAKMQDRFGLLYQVSDVPVVNATGLKSHYYSANHHAEKFGYVPAMTSLEGLVAEFQKVLAKEGSE